MADDTDVQQQTGVMVALFLPAPDADALAVPDQEPAAELHMTLGFLGTVDQLSDEQKEMMRSAVAAVAREWPPIDARVSGIGRFSNVPEGQPHCIYASIDAPLVPEFRQAVVEQLALHGLQVSRLHGFTPHVTLAYVEPTEPTVLFDDGVPALEISFRFLTAAIGPDRIHYPLQGDAPE